MVYLWSCNKSYDFDFCCTAPRFSYLPAVSPPIRKKKKVDSCISAKNIPKGLLHLAWPLLSVWHPHSCRRKNFTFFFVKSFLISEWFHSILRVIGFEKCFIQFVISDSTKRLNRSLDFTWVKLFGLKPQMYDSTGTYKYLQQQNSNYSRPYSYSFWRRCCILYGNSFCFTCRFNLPEFSSLVTYEAVLVPHIFRSSFRSLYVIWMNKRLPSSHYATQCFPYRRFAHKTRLFWLLIFT